MPTWTTFQMICVIGGPLDLEGNVDRLDHDDDQIPFAAPARALTPSGEDLYSEGLASRC